MTLKGRSIVSIGDLSRAEIELIFRCAERFAAQPRGQTHLGRGFQLATLFFEPSTRTRLSFESAMNRLGGAVLTVADGAQSSASKGETLSDTARIVSAYADVIVLRHPAEGAARVAADAAGVPVINGGDGAHEHPTQTLCDLYTLGQECGKIEGLTVTLYGDLKYGRTVHSLAYGLALFGGRIIFAPADPALAPPAYVLEELRNVYGVEPEWWDPNGGTPMPAADALYLTRVQKERFSGSSAGTRDYPRINKAILQQWGVPDYTVLMHPLPRAGELDPELDSETRSAYFRQAAYGVPVRMAAIALILGIAEEEWASGWGGRHGAVPGPGNTLTDAHATTEFSAEGLCCANPGCITNREPGSAEGRFVLASLDPSRGVRCRYCDALVRASIGDVQLGIDECEAATDALLADTLLAYAPLGAAD